MAFKWHIPDLTALEKKLNTNLSEGLSVREARHRLDSAVKKEKGSIKSLFVADKRSTLSCLLSYASTPFVILLALMALLTAIFGRPLLGYSVLTVTVAAAVFGGIINHRFQRKIESMREYASPMVRVKRGGNVFHTDGRNIVPGDIIFLTAGDLLTCDARIIKCEELTAEELYYNGRNVANRRVQKFTDISYESNDSVTAPNAENMLYAGSAVMNGKAVALVCEIGEDVYLSNYLRAGALDGKNAEPVGIQKLRPVVHKISFICASALLILSLIGLLTLRGSESFVCVFTMLLSAVFLTTAELLTGCSYAVMAKRIKLLTSTNKRTKNYAVSIRNAKAADILSGVTDLVFVGSAGFSVGLYKLSSAYIGGEKLNDITPKNGARLLDLMHMYVKAIGETDSEESFCFDGYSDAISAHLRSCGFDLNEASLAIRSIYYAKDEGYACAETESGFYRAALSFDGKILSSCKYVRDGESLRQICDGDVVGIEDFIRDSESSGHKCLFIVSEQNDMTTFEGIVTFETEYDPEIADAVADLHNYNVNTVVLLDKEDEKARHMISDPALSSLFVGKIAYASEFAANGKNILSELGSYCAYVGFGSDDHIALISAMKKRGSSVAAFGIENKDNALMSRADIVVSCDVIKYESEKYKMSVYERLPFEGREANLRCSQQTRLLSKVIVKRAGASGGGASSVFRAIKAAREGYISLTQAVLLFIMLMTPMLTLVAMSVLTGNMLLDPLQTVSLASVYAFLSITAFDDSHAKRALLLEKRRFSDFPIEEIRRRLPGVIARASVAFVTAVTVKILDARGAFGEDPTYTLPICICLLLSVFSEVFISNYTYAQNGEKKTCWLKVLAAYGILLSVCAISTQKPLSNEFYANGIGSFEFFIVPAYVILYATALLSVKLIEKIRKKA